jgi:hypothetical protein
MEARRNFVTSGGLKKVQELQAEQVRTCARACLRACASAFVNAPMCARQCVLEYPAEYPWGTPTFLKWVGPNVCPPVRACAWWSVPCAVCVCVCGVRCVRARRGRSSASTSTQSTCATPRRSCGNPPPRPPLPHVCACVPLTHTRAGTTRPTTRRRCSRSSTATRFPRSTTQYYPVTQRRASARTTHGRAGGFACEQRPRHSDALRSSRLPRTRAGRTQ